MSPASSSISCRSALRDSRSSSSSGGSDSGSDSGWGSSQGLFVFRHSNASYTSVSSSCVSSVPSSLPSRRPLPPVPLSTSNRPLPSVPQVVDPDTSQTLVQPHPSPLHPNAPRPVPPRSDSLLALTTVRKLAVAPTLNVVPGFHPHTAPTEVMSDSPTAPLTPITFRNEGSKKQRMTREAKLALRLSTFGFVEGSESDEESRESEDTGEDVAFLMDRVRFKRRYGRKWSREKLGRREDHSCV